MWDDEFYLKRKKESAELPLREKTYRIIVHVFILMTAIFF